MVKANHKNSPYEKIIPERVLLGLGKIPIVA